jgi:hypothetical protein
MHTFKIDSFFNPISSPNAELLFVVTKVLRCSIKASVRYFHCSRNKGRKWNSNQRYSYEVKIICGMEYYKINKPVMDKAPCVVP